MSTTTAAEIVFDHVTKRYPGREQPALADLTLERPAGTFCVLVGPSGGGNTTALKMINRLIPFDSGEIRIDGRSILDLPLVELRRGIGYVIQQIGLFPHRTISENIGAVPQLLGWKKELAWPAGLIWNSLAGYLDRFQIWLSDNRNVPSPSATKPRPM